ncbi:MAGL2-like protein [Mya arenaria]|uniref:MAGL2-like protein n=1 Tax=Mya arenaria TaxID=6604 RepID=A0ABY7FKU3_MYAAR|nr:MAGL2-like protein [Mya arenaria]
MYQESTPTTNMYQESTPTTNMYQESTPTTNMYQESTPTTNMYQESTPTTNMYQESTPTTNMYQESTPTTNMYQESTPTTNMYQESTPTTYMYQESTPTTYMYQESTPTTNMYQESTPKTYMYQESTPTTNMYQESTPTTDKNEISEQPTQDERLGRLERRCWVYGDISMSWKQNKQAEMYFNNMFQTDVMTAKPAPPTRSTRTPIAMMQSILRMVRRRLMAPSIAASRGTEQLYTGTYALFTRARHVPSEAKWVGLVAVGAVVLMVVLVAIIQKGKEAERSVWTMSSYAGGRREADIATPTRDPAFPPSTERATPAPDGTAISIPTHRALNSPLHTNILKMNLSMWYSLTKYRSFV